MDDNRGISLVLVNTKKGEDIFNEISSSLTYKKVDIETAIQYNNSAIASSKRHPKREAFFNQIDDFPINQVLKRFCRDSIKTRIRRKLSILKKIRKN